MGRSINFVLPLSLLLVWFACADMLVPSLRAESCVTVDFSENLGPVKNQGREGLCWAFSASAVMRNQICKENPLKCSDRSFELSALDGMACTKNKKNVFKVGSQAEGGGRPEWALACMLDGGVCEEKQAPYAKYQSVYASPEKAAQLNACIEEREAPCDTERPLVNFFSSASTEDQRAPDLIAALANIKKSVDCVGAVKDPNLLPPESYCVYQTVISPECEKGRHRVGAGKEQALMPNSVGLMDLSRDERKATLDRVLERRDAISLAVCMEWVNLPDVQAIYGAVEGSSPQNKQCGSGHAVTVGGVRCHNGQKQYYIFNSWGEGAPFHGWIDADVVVDAAMDATYLKSGGNK